MKKIMILAAFALLSGFSPNLQAQWAISPHIVVALPKEKFANINQTGGGLGLGVERQITGRRKNGFTLKGDLTFINFGKKRQLGLTNYGTDLIKFSDNAMRLIIGPQYRFGSKALKLYFGAAGGAHYFLTNITSSNGASLGSQNEEWSLGWNLGGGILYDIGMGPFIDVSFEYQTIYGVGGNKVNEVGEVISTPEVTANEYTIKVGVIFFIR